MYFMSSTKKKTALIGGSGYLGNYLGRLLAPAFEVVYTSRTKKEQSLQVDFLKPETFDQLKQKGPFDIIFILASSLQGLGTTVLKEEYLNVDTLGLAAFLQFISDHQLSTKIIYTSSMTVYGTQNIVPVKEEGILAPLSTYGLSKVLAEKTIAFYCDSTAVKGVTLRIPGIYGGNRTSGFIYQTIHKCIRNEPVMINTSALGYWETMHIHDCASVMKSFLERYEWIEKHATFNVGYGTKTDIIDCAFAIKQILGSMSAIEVVGEKGYLDFYLDASRIKKYVQRGNSYRQSLENYVKTFST
jgi:UDP-glucose 4-epimerase